MNDKFVDDDVDRIGERLMSELMSLDGSNSAGRKKGTRSVGVTFVGDLDDVPDHVERIADRYDASIVHKSTAVGGRGLKTRINLVSDDRLHHIDIHAARYSKDWSLVYDRSDDDLSIKALERSDR